MSFYTWLDEEIEWQNQIVLDDEGVRGFFCTDRIYEAFLDECSISDKVCDDDKEDVLKPLFDNWIKTSKPFEYTSKEIKAQKREDAADLATQAMEMGYHNYSSDNGGTWYQD